MRIVSTAGIVLAAGFSRRLGRPKQEVVLGGETLLMRAVQTARNAGLSPVFVVLNGIIEPSAVTEPPSCLVLVNTHPEEGLASSIRVGVNAAESQQNVSGAIFMTCDQVLLTVDHLRQLSGDIGRVTASAYGGRRGVPAYFPRHSFSSLLQLSGDAGARELLVQAHTVQAEELLLDIDTQEDLERAEAHFAQSSV